MAEINLEDFCRDFCREYVNIQNLQKISNYSEEMKEKADYARKQCEYCPAKKLYNYLIAKNIINS